MMFVGATHQAVLDAGFGQARVAGMRVVGLIAIDRFLIATEQMIRRLGVGDRSVRHVDAADDRVAGIHSRVGLRAEEARFAFPAPARITIRRWFGRLSLRTLASLTVRRGPSRAQ